MDSFLVVYVNTKNSLSYTSTLWYQPLSLLVVYVTMTTRHNTTRVCCMCVVCVMYVLYACVVWSTHLFNTDDVIHHVWRRPCNCRAVYVLLHDLCTCTVWYGVNCVLAYCAWSGLIMFVRIDCTRLRESDGCVYVRTYTMFDDLLCISVSLCLCLWYRIRTRLCVHPFVRPTIRVRSSSYLALSCRGINCTALFRGVPTYIRTYVHM